MARPPAGPGDNSGALTHDEKVSLAFHHSEKVRRALEELEPLKDAVSAAQKNVTKLYKLAGAEGFPKKVIEDALKEASLPIFAQRSAEETRQVVRKARGLVNQLDFFGDNKTPKEAQDEMDWTAEGYRIGLHAGPPDPRKAMCPTRFDQSFMAGWHDGQKEQQRRFLVAQDVLERRAQPFGQTDAEAADEAEDEVDEDAAIDEAAEALRGSAFMDTTAEGFDLVDDEDGHVPVEGDEAEETERAEEGADDVVLEALSEMDEAESEDDRFMRQVAEVVDEDDAAVEPVNG